MAKLFLILLFIVIASFGAQASHLPVSCKPLFDDPERTMLAKEQVLEFIAPNDIKRKLLKQVYSHYSMRDFILEYSRLANDLHEAQFARALRGEAPTNYKILGFESVEDLRGSREDVLNKQIKVLSVMDSQDMTPEFAHDFKLMVIKVYDVNTPKRELVRLSKRLDQIYRIYSKLL